ncbi:MAG: hypothetical protein KJ600_05435 [Nanoarchaeota archaeon]|nr:hypothetical protein [Nanoarchaeota archaeon]MBU1103970.1 hypothetical protein [Nanoarchaeota archaeon]
MQQETLHLTNVLEQVKTAISTKNIIQLKDLSNQTIHSASSDQDSASITTAVIVYTLSKLIERADYKRIRNWENFVKKFNGFLTLAIKSLKENNQEKYNDYISQARKTLESHSITLKPYIQDVLKKSSINKGSKIYEHGISLEQTAKLLGITQWELSDYIGSRTLADVKQNQTLNVKERAKMAMEFFS